MISCIYAANSSATQKAAFITFVGTGVAATLGKSKRVGLWLCQT